MRSAYPFDRSSCPCDLLRSHSTAFLQTDHHETTDHPKSTNDDPVISVIDQSHSGPLVVLEEIPQDVEIRMGATAAAIVLPDEGELPEPMFPGLRAFAKKLGLTD